MPHEQLSPSFLERASAFRAGVKSAVNLINDHLEARTDPALLRTRIESEYASSEVRGMVADVAHLSIDAAEALKKSAQEAIDARPLLAQTERVVTSTAKTTANVAAGVFALTGVLAINGGLALYDGVKKAGGVATQYSKSLGEIVSDIRNWKDDTYPFD